MGTQESCCAEPAPPNGASEVQITKEELRLHRAGKFAPCEPFPIAPAAAQAYQQLLTQFSNNKYLDLKSQPGAQAEEVDGHYRLSNLEAVYSGEWRNGKPNGRGVATLANGAVLVGSFSDGACMGDYNYLFFPDGSRYAGNIIGNRISGNGKLTTPTVVYEGEWHDNLPQGKGMETFANGDRFIGTFEKGLKHGEDCTFTWSNHDTLAEYKGSFWEGRIQGWGKLTFGNKTWLEGQFEGDSIHKLTFASTNAKFTGSFEAGRATGKGVLEILDSKESFNGNFREGKLYGQCRVTDSKQRETETFFLEGRQFKQLVGLPDKEALRIARVVEGAYGPAAKHTEALAEINQDLEEEYECRFVEPFESLFKFSSYLTLNVYDKVLLVRAKK